MMLSFDAPSGNKDPGKSDCYDINPGGEHCSNDGYNPSGDPGHLVHHTPMSSYTDSSDSKNIVYSDTKLQHPDVKDGVKDHRMESDNKIEIGNQKPPLSSAVQIEIYDGVYAGRKLECIDIKHETDGCDSNSGDIQWMHGSRNQIECSVCEKKYDNFTEYTHHLNMHLEKSGEGTISVDLPSSQIQSHQDSIGVIKKKSSQQDQSGQIDSNIHGNNKTNQNPKLHVQVNLQTSKKLEPLPSTSYVKLVASQPDLTRHNNLEHGLFISCTLCDKSFAFRENLNVHIAAEHGGKPFSCTLCDESFGQKVALNRHVETTHRGKMQPYLCTLCAVSFARKDEINLHNNTAHPKPFPCTLCDKSYSLKADLNRHTNAVHHKLKPFSCTLCDKIFTYSYNLNRHIKSTHHKLKNVSSKLSDKSFAEKCRPSSDIKTVHNNNVKSFSCTLCDKSFMFEENLIRHKQIHGQREVPKTSPAMKQLDTNNCSRNINESFGRNHETKAELMSQPVNDNETKNQSEIYAISIHRTCEFQQDGKKEIINVTPLNQQDNIEMKKSSIQYDETCTSIGNEEISINQEDKTSIKPNQESHDNTEPETKFPLTCRAREKSLESLDLTKQDDSVRQKMKQFSCTLCKKSFVKLRSRTKHIKRCHNNLAQKALFPCTFCDKSFAHKRSLNCHIDFVHHKLKTFSCTFCDRSFMRNKDLTAHVDTIHHKLRPFKCTLCEKSFGRREHLKGHIKIVHDKLTSFFCTFCDKSFAQKRNLNKHMKIHHKPTSATGNNRGPKSFSCTLCEKSFGQKVHLKTHVERVHEKLKPFSCTLCDKSFSDKSFLSRHIDGVHRKLKPFSCTLCDKSFGQKAALNEHISTLHHMK